MREQELFEYRLPVIEDEERLELIQFIINWVRGSYMKSPPVNMLRKWERINQLFPSKVNSPISLMRLVTLPIRYADQKEFDLKKPAPNNIGSWTSTHFGISSVAGVAADIDANNENCRIVIVAKIDPKNILITPKSLKKAFLSLTSDYHSVDDFEITSRELQDDGSVYVTTSYKPYLGDASEDMHDELGYYQALFRESHGGPMRQYEYIVRTTPLRVRNIKVLRKGDQDYESIDYHDDPHNSGNYRGWRWQG
jgi:hypothetical protein